MATDFCISLSKSFKCDGIIESSWFGMLNCVYQGIGHNIWDIFLKSICITCSASKFCHMHLLYCIWVLMWLFCLIQSGNAICEVNHINFAIIVTANNNSMSKSRIHIVFFYLYTKFILVVVWTLFQFRFLYIYNFFFVPLSFSMLIQPTSFGRTWTERFGVLWGQLIRNRARRSEKMLSVRKVKKERNTKLEETHRVTLLLLLLPSYQVMTERDGLICVYRSCSNMFNVF
jgi:hypothetical protein